MASVEGSYCALLLSIASWSYDSLSADTINCVFLCDLCLKYDLAPMSEVSTPDEMDPAGYGI